MMDKLRKEKQHGPSSPWGGGWGGYRPLVSEIELHSPRRVVFLDHVVWNRNRVQGLTILFCRVGFVLPKGAK